MHVYLAPSSGLARFGNLGQTTIVDGRAQRKRRSSLYSVLSALICVNRRFHSAFALDDEDHAVIVDVGPSRSRDDEVAQRAEEAEPSLLSRSVALSSFFCSARFNESGVGIERKKERGTSLLLALRRQGSIFRVQPAALFSFSLLPFTNRTRRPGCGGQSCAAAGSDPTIL